MTGDLVAALGHRPAGERWIVEVLLDTGQRLHAFDKRTQGAIDVAGDMLSTTSVTLVTLIAVATGEAFEELGVNVWAARGMPADPWYRARRRRELVAERLGAR